MTNLALEIPAPALDWLDNNIAPALASRTVKRMAFKVSINGNEMVVAADATGKTKPVYSLFPYEGMDIIELNGKPTAIAVAPEGVDNLSKLLSGLEIDITADMDDEALEAEIAAALQAGEKDDDFNPSVKDVVMALEEAPKAITEPATTKSRKKKGTAKSFRTKILDKLIDELGVEIPPEEEMFHKFKDNPAVSFVPFKELAACNHPAHLTTTARGEFAKGLVEVLGFHKDNNIRNILNLSAEIDTNRVFALVGTLLRYSRLIHCPEACDLDGPIPHSATMNAAGTSPEPFDANAKQVWTGRHRVLALAFIYGSDVKIPVMLSTKSYREASEDCVESNKCRPMGKAEQIHHEQLQRSLTIGGSAAGQFASMKGDKKKIANFIVYHTVVQTDSDLFTRPKFLKVEAKRSPKNITLPFYRSAVEFALTSGGLNSATKLDNKVTRGINLIITALDILFKKIEEKFVLDAERKLVWTYYSAGAFGSKLGELLHDSIKNSDVDYSAEDAAEEVLGMIVGLFSNNTTEVAKNLFAKEPPASLSDHLTLYAKGYSEEDEDEGLASGIVS
jgi:hypothetical protein